MGRPGITKEQVWEAADALVQEGLTPTVKAVRERVGGSFSTVTPYLAEWREANEGRQAAEMPALPEAVTQASRQIWVAALRSAQESVETERQALDAARREMMRERQEMAEEIARLERAVEAARAETATTGKARLEAEAAGTALRIENTRLEERAGGAEREREAARTEVARLGKALRETGQEAAGLRAEKARLEEQVAQTEPHHRQASETILRLEKAADATKVEREKLSATLEAARQAHTEGEAARSALRVENARLTERVTNVTTRTDELRAQVDALENRLAQLAGERPTKPVPSTTKATKTTARKQPDPSHE
jgi:chromosome segregation ATPase